MSESSTRGESGVPAPLPVRGLLARLTTGLLGYDAFVSHAHGDALLYAERLVRRLAGRNCFLDREENQVGDHLRPALGRALRRSRVLIVVASPRAVRSRWVKLEWSHFQSLGRRTIVVEVDGACDEAPWMLDEDPIRIQESTQALASGSPSEHVVEHILRSFVFTSRVTLARRILAAGALSILIAAALAVRFGLEAQTIARKEARQRRVAERVLELFVELVARADPYTETRPTELKMLDVLIAATQRDFTVDASAAVEGRMRLALGRSLAKLGAYDLALRELEIARSRLDADRDATAAEGVDVRNEIAGALLELGEFDRAREPIEEALGMLGQQGEVSALLSLTARYYDVWHAMETGQAAAEERLHALIDDAVSGLGMYDERVLCGLVTAADLLMWRGDLGVARALLEPALHDCERRLGSDHPCTLEAMRTLAWLEYFAEDYHRAAELADTEHELRVRRVGVDHPESVWSLRTLACALLAAGDLAEAEPLYREALARIGRNPVPMQWRTGLVKRDLAGLLHASGRSEEALHMALEAVADLVRTRGESHFSTIAAMEQCAQICGARGDLDEATSWGRRTQVARELHEARKRQLSGN